MKKTVLFFLLTVLSFSLSAAPVIYQAENGTLNGTNIATALAGYQGTGYVTGFDNAGDYCQVTVNVASAGMYTITLGYAATMGPKINDLYVNGVFQAGVSFPSTSGFSSVTAGIVPLNAGNNTLRIQNNWGYFFLDWFGVEAAVLPPLNVPDSLVNANSSAATKCLMSYLVSNYGVKTLSGQDTINSSEWINTNTGKYPAICGFDMMDYSPSRVAYGAADPLQVEQAIAWYQSGGIVQFQWHWNAPSGLINTAGCEWWRGFYTTCTTFDVEYAMNNISSQQYQDIIRDIDAIAVQLLRLRNAGVPVLWRPLHEAQGEWFWWGAKGYAPCMALYDLVYDRLTNHHGLNNLIWVWTSEDNASAINWYPGNSKVDVVGADIYLSGLNYSPSTAMFYNLVNLTGGQKLVAMTENGTIPDPDAMEAQNAHWSWFMTWNGYQNNPAQNTLAHVQYVYNHGYITTRDELAGVYNCSPGTPTRTITRTVTRTATRTFTPTATRTATSTAVQSATFTATRTAASTAVQSATFTATSTAVQSETFTATRTATSTSVQSATFTATRTATSTSVQSATFTVTRTATSTAVQSATFTTTSTATSTAVQSPAYTATGTSTATAVESATFTATRTATAVESGTAVETASLTVTVTPTVTETITTTYTYTQTITEIITPTIQPTNTSTPTITRTTTYTPTCTATVIPSATRTVTPALTPSQTPVAESSVLNVTLAESYPNPVIASAGANVRMDYYITKTSDTVKISIYTGAYRKVMEKRVQGAVAAGRGSLFVDTAGFSPGAYYWQVEAVSGEKKARSKPQVMVILK